MIEGGGPLGAALAIGGCLVTATEALKLITQRRQAGEAIKAEEVQEILRTQPGEYVVCFKPGFEV